jgi:FlaG/FlaF family flagellin (archaellin)
VIREVPLLMRVGVIMMALAIALVIAAVVVSVTLGSEPERRAPYSGRARDRQRGRRGSYSLGIVRQFGDQIDDA